MDRNGYGASGRRGLGADSVSAECRTAVKPRVVPPPSSRSTGLGQYRQTSSCEPSNVLPLLCFNSCTRAMPQRLAKSSGTPSVAQNVLVESNHSIGGRFCGEEFVETPLSSFLPCFVRSALPEHRKQASASACPSSGRTNGQPTSPMVSATGGMSDATIASLRAIASTSVPPSPSQREGNDRTSAAHMRSGTSVRCPRRRIAGHPEL